MVSQPAAVDGALRICLFAAVPPPLTGFTYATQLLRDELRRAGQQVAHINPVLARSVADYGKPRLAKLLAALRHLVALAREAKTADVVLMTMSFRPLPYLKDFLTLLVARRLGRRPVVIWTNTSDMPALAARGATWRLALRVAMREATRVVVVGDQLARPFLEFTSPEKVTTIPNCVPDNATPGTPPLRARPRVIFLSNMFRSKGWPVLLEAAGRLQAAHGLELHFYGEPTSEDTPAKIERAIRAVSGGESIRYCGAVHGAEKHRAFAASDIFCLPTEYPLEALPLSILEAMSHSLPVVSTAVGAIPDAVAHCRGGFLVPPGNAEALARAIDILIRRPELRRRMGRFNRERFVRRYRVEAVGAEWVRLLNDASGRPLRDGARSRDTG